MEPATRLFLHITDTNRSNFNSNDAHARGVEAIGISRFPNTGLFVAMSGTQNGQFEGYVLCARPGLSS